MIIRIGANPVCPVILSRVSDIFRTRGDTFSYRLSRYLSSSFFYDWSLMVKRRILIVDNNDELRVLLEQALGRLGHEVIVTGERAKALRRDDLDTFDLIISDLSEAEVNGEPISELHRKHLVTELNGHKNGPGVIKAFKLGAANYLRVPYDRDELREIVEQTLANKLRYLDDTSAFSHVHEKIEFELPSDLALMNGVLDYLQERVAKLGLIRPERSNLFVALDEASVSYTHLRAHETPEHLV